MSSAEPAKTVVYSLDIGWSVVWLRMSCDMSYRSIAKRLQIGIGTAHKIISRFVDTGDVQAGAVHSRPECRKLNDLHETYILGLIAKNRNVLERNVKKSMMLLEYLFTVSNHSTKWIYQKEDRPSCKTKIEVNSWLLYCNTQ